MDVLQIRLHLVTKKGTCCGEVEVRVAHNIVHVEAQREEVERGGEPDKQLKKSTLLTWLALG